MTGMAPINGGPEARSHCVSHLLGAILKEAAAYDAAEFDLVEDVVAVGRVCNA